MLRRMGLGLLVVGFFGCASSAELENQSRMHSLRADAAAQRRDYGAAASEQHEARELHAKAVERAAKEGHTNQIPLESDVPAPPAP
jgi:hypothetical protein